VVTDGVKISLLDDFTTQFEESLLAFGAPNLTYTSTTFDSGEEDSKFTKERNNTSDIDAFIEILKLRGNSPSENVDDYLFSQSELRVKIEAMYFNHKSFGEEFLIEPYSLVMTDSQQSPLKATFSRIYSADMLNINLTYGCITSLDKAMNEIREEEEK